MLVGQQGVVVSLSHQALGGAAVPIAAGVFAAEELHRTRLGNQMQERRVQSKHMWTWPAALLLVLLLPPLVLDRALQRLSMQAPAREQGCRRDGLARHTQESSIKMEGEDAQLNRQPHKFGGACA